MICLNISIINHIQGFMYLFIYLFHFQEEHHKNMTNDNNK